MTKAITTSNLTTSSFDLNALPDTMNAPQTLLRSLRASRQIPRCTRLTNAPPRRQFTSSFFRRKKQPSADDPEFVSILDGPPQLVRVGKRHGPGLLVLGMAS
jgi:surfeit locus 1 family protein